MPLEITITKENTHAFAQHTHAGWEFMLYTKGNGTLKTAVGNFSFSPGTLIAVPPNTAHGSVSDDTFVNICIHTDHEAFPSDRKILYYPSANIETRMLFELISKFYFNTDYPREHVAALVALLSDLLMTEEAASTIDHIAFKLHEYIAENFRSPTVSIHTFIQENGYCDDYCRIHFKQKYGVTPHEYLLSLRMQYAKTLLKTYHRALKIQEVARLCGYTDSLYFSRQFKQFFHESPSAYNKKQRSIEQ